MFVDGEIRGNGKVTTADGKIATGDFFGKSSNNVRMSKFVYLEKEDSGRKDVYYGPVRDFTVMEG